MVSMLKFLVISCAVFYVNANFTRISRNNVLLSRRKRYLAFPMGSNLVMTLSMVKAFLQIQPRGWNSILECDVPFALPSEADFFLKKKKKKKKGKEKRSIYSQLDAALTSGGLNGTACVQRIICDAQQYIPQKGKSLVKDMLLAIFTSSELDFGEKYNGNCVSNIWEDCEIPFLDYILGSLDIQGNVETT